MELEFNSSVYTTWMDAFIQGSKAILKNIKIWSPFFEYSKFHSFFTISIILNILKHKKYK